MSDRLISTVDSLLENHVLNYSCIDSGKLAIFDSLGTFLHCVSGDFEFVSSLVWIVMTCLHSGGYSTLPSGAPVYRYRFALEVNGSCVQRIVCSLRIEKALGSSN